jgi:hypothetical protein
LTERAFRTIHTAKSTRSASSNILHHLTDICKEIPEKYDAERHGIHSYCYQHFTNIPHVKAAVQRATALVALARSPRKPRRQPCSSTSASGKSSTVLLPQNRCLFCDKGWAELLWCYTWSVSIMSRGYGGMLTSVIQKFRRRLGLAGRQQLTAALIIIIIIKCWLLRPRNMAVQFKGARVCDETVRTDK